MTMIDWRDYIHADSEILRGKPVICGTRLSVEFLLGLFAAGWSDAQILENYPTLTPEALLAVFAFAAESLREETLYALPEAADLTIQSPAEGQRYFLRTAPVFVMPSKGHGHQPENSNL